MQPHFSLLLQQVTENYQLHGRFVSMGIPWIVRHRIHRRQHPPAQFGSRSQHGHGIGLADVAVHFNHLFRELVRGMHKLFHRPIRQDGVD